MGIGRLGVIVGLLVCSPVVGHTQGTPQSRDTAPDMRPTDIYGRSFPKLAGEDVYKNICQGCHMPNAMGATGAGTYPKLAGNANLTAAEFPVTMVMFGRKAMPPLGAYLTDVQIANVVNYIRSHFGNQYTDIVTAADVAKVRRSEQVDEEGNVIGRK